MVMGWVSPWVGLGWVKSPQRTKCMRLEDNPTEPNPWIGPAMAMSDTLA